MPYIVQSEVARELNLHGNMLLYAEMPLKEQNKQTTTYSIQCACVHMTFATTGTPQLPHMYKNDKRRFRFVTSAWRSVAD